MTIRATPIVVGVGETKNCSQKVSDAIEPLVLILQSIHEALKDTSLSDSERGKLQAEIDGISVVAPWTWNYYDLPGLIARKLGVEPSYKTISEHNGASPARLFDEAARRISFGECKVAVVTGGEAMASLMACAAAGKMPPPGWEEADEDAEGIAGSSTFRKAHNIGNTHGIGLPIQVYPLYENAFRAHRNQTIRENNKESAKLYAEFAKVAEKHPMAWNYGQPAADEASIGTVSKKNRMICFPYPLLMNAFNNVNVAGSCILTSTEYAKELGIPENQWIYPLGGAGTIDSAHFWERPNYFASPAISKSLDAGLEVSGLTKDDIGIFDFYSCFPIVPKLACQHLGFSPSKPEKPITLLGGLTSFGGAGNNYSMHALAAMVRELRKGNAENGLVLANGGVVTYQHVVCLSTKPRKTPYPDENPLLTEVPDESPAIEERPEGEAIVETYTVDFSRDGKAKRGFIVGKLCKKGHRFLANEEDKATLLQLASDEREPIGRKGWVKSAGNGKGRNLFCFDAAEKL
ncbi:hypothetical protein HYALB_00012659 [Hymenoscyphus albidus]|uniref:Thiolase-like protein type 1 additional C-terminal domain-containing protein n=1 Tax=Hymenoscyphus albidus TaxID=595503 RepID=A0A9N9LPB3_9HELO|nr:hypothetical protein HYALB_00012659 [Hymenoscyphus albidus]